MMTKNHTTTTSLVILAAVAATLLAASTVAIASNYSAFAWKDKDKEKYNKEDNYSKDENYNKGYDKSSTDGGTSVGDGQAIVQSNSQSQEGTCLTAGAGSLMTGSCNNAATATNTNNGGNARTG